VSSRTFDQDNKPPVNAAEITGKPGRALATRNRSEAAT
jgi:hypothetical protein